jgi:Cu/Ag efflux pump CusA
MSGGMITAPLLSLLAIPAFYLPWRQRLPPNSDPA